MEGGASYGSYNGGQGANSGYPNATAAANESVQANPAEGSHGQNPAPSPAPPAIREQDRFMPIANVIRIMRKVLPTHAKISDDAKETIQECVSEYISFITSEANERCQREQRKTITAEDVLWAMSKLGFDDYIEPLSVYLHRYRELEGDHRGSIRGDPLPILKHRHHHNHNAPPLHAAPPPNHHHDAQPLYAAQPPPAQSYMGPPQHGMHHQYGGVYGDGMGGYYGMYGGAAGDHGHGGGASASMPNNFDPPYAYK